MNPHLVVSLCLAVSMILCFNLSGFKLFYQEDVGCFGQSRQFSNFQRDAKYFQYISTLTSQSAEEIVGYMLFKQAFIFLKEYKSEIQDCGIKTIRKCSWQIDQLWNSYELLF